MRNQNSAVETNTFAVDSRPADLLTSAHTLILYTLRCWHYSHNIGGPDLVNRGIHSVVARSAVAPADQVSYIAE